MKVTIDNTHINNNSTDTYGSLPILSLVERLQTDFPRQPIQLVMFGNFGAWNAGDEAILTGQLHSLVQLPHVRVSIVSRFPTQIMNNYKKPAVSLRNPFAIIAQVLRSDGVIFGGGGIISKNDNGIISFIYQLYISTFFLLLPLLFRKKLYVIGLGIYENANRFVLAYTTRLLKHAALVTVRDKHSYQLLHKRGVVATFLKDNSFLMPLVSRDTVLQTRFFGATYHAEKFNVGICLKNPTDKTEQEVIIAIIKQFIEKNNQQTEFWFYCLDAHPGYPNDYEFVKMILNSLDTSLTPSIHVVPVDLPAQLVFSSFQLLDFLIAERLHAVIFSYRVSVPFLGIAYDLKCQSFLSSIGKPYATSLQNALLTEEFRKVKRLASIN